MIRATLLLSVFLLTLLVGQPVFAVQEPTPDALIALSEEDRELVEMLKLLEMLELLSALDEVAALEEKP